jgi:hypothetical protein
MRVIGGRQFYTHVLVEGRAFEIYKGNYEMALILLPSAQGPRIGLLYAERGED